MKVTKLNKNNKIRLVLGCLLLAILLWLWVYVFVFGNELKYFGPICGAILSFFAVVVSFPSKFEWLYKLWTALALALNKFIVRSLLTIIYYLMITPVGIIRRVMKKDDFSKRICIDGSYRQQSRSIAREDMENPF